MHSSLALAHTGETPDSEEGEEEEEEEEEDEHRPPGKEEEEGASSASPQQTSADSGGGGRRRAASRDTVAASAFTAEDEGSAALMLSFASSGGAATDYVSDGTPSSSRDNDGERGDQDDDDDDGTIRGGRVPKNDDDDENDDDEMKPQSKEWVEIPGGFSLKKSLDDQVYDATMIQRLIGVRRATKGIEVLIRGRLRHFLLGPQSGLACAVVTARAEPPVLLCVAKDDVSTRVYVADLETDANVASSAESCDSAELGMVFKALAESELVDDSKAASQDMTNFAVKTKGEPRLICSFLKEGAKLHR